MSSGASCSIVLTPTGKPFYSTGETISGNVILTIGTSVDLKSIEMEMIGRLVYTVTAKDSTHTVRQDFFVQKQPLVVPVMNGITSNEDGYHLEPNTYQWPFSVRLPQNLPPSLLPINQDIPYIQYFLQVNMDRSWLHHNIRSQLSIVVTPHVPRPQEVRFLESEESNLRDLHIYGKLLRNYLLIGEPSITLELNIENPSQTTIKEVIVTLIQRRRLAQHNGRAIISEHSLLGIVDFQNTHLHQTFEIPVNPTVEFSAPTSFYRNPNNPTETFIVDYVLEVKFKTKLFFTNVTLEFPLLVVNGKRSLRTAA